VPFLRERDRCGRPDQAERDLFNLRVRWRIIPGALRIPRGDGVLHRRGTRCAARGRSRGGGRPDAEQASGEAFANHAPARRRVRPGSLDSRWHADGAGPPPSLRSRVPPARAETLASDGRDAARPGRERGSSRGSRSAARTKTRTRRRLRLRPGSSASRRPRAASPTTLAKPTNVP